jgi:diguanylate cyclase (GGDEF)-like protein
MPGPGKDQNNMIDNLLQQGVPQADITKVYQSLREKGYGEEEARRRSRAAIERLKEMKKLEERRSQRLAASSKSGSAAKAAPAVNDPDLSRRAVDSLPALPLWLRRQINRYSFRNGFLATRMSERFDDMICTFDPKRPDYVSPLLVRLLAEEQGYREANPYHLSFIDTLDALRDSASRLLGRQDPNRPPSEAAQAILQDLQSREPFAVEFFSQFTQPHDMLRKSLEYLGVSLRAHRRVRVGHVARVAKDGCRLIMVTSAVEPEKLDALYNLVREVNLEHSPGPRTAQRCAEAEGLFRAGFKNLSLFAHELYPVVLKMIPAFYAADDVSPAKVAAVRGVLSVREEDLLTWEGWQRRMAELRERELRERQERDLARLEQEKAQRFSMRFEGTLSTLASLFPGSGIERIEQGAYVVPYFVNRVFSRSPSLQARLPDLERISSSDGMGLVLILHTMLDDMFSSIGPYVVEKLAGGDGMAASLIDLRSAWRDAYPKLFEPYLDNLREYEKEGGGNPNYGPIGRQSERALGIEEGVNQIRGRAIKGFGHINTDRERFDGPKLHELAARLSELATEMGRAVNQTSLAAEDPVSRRVMDELGKHGIVDFVASTKVGTVDYHPVTRQIKRWIEARFRESVLDIPQKAQVGFVDVFRGVAYMYDALLNDPKSPVAATAHGIAAVTDADREAWKREIEARGRDTDPLLQATLMEQFPGQFMDALTGLRNKDYFLTELPRVLQKLRQRHQPIALLMIDIDHFKWVNDELGHPRGDEILKATGGLLLDNIREGDIAVRYGGEELLIVAAADLHTAVVLAERLRHGQESRLIASVGMLDVRRISKERSQPCGTLSVGVADITSIVDMQKAVEKADKALYAAKKIRNTVSLVSPASGGREEKLVTYSEYRDARAGSPGSAPRSS